MLLGKNVARKIVLGKIITGKNVIRINSHTIVIRLIVIGQSPNLALARTGSKYLG